MSDKPIQRGDLVMVVRGCPYCGTADDLGKIFTAKTISVFDDCCVMECCAHTITGKYVDDAENSNQGWPLRTLKRLDPGNISEDVPTGEEITA